MTDTPTQTTDLYKVVWTDGWNRETVADKLVAEKLSFKAAHELRDRLRVQSADPSNWWVVKRQKDPPLARHEGVRVMSDNATKEPFPRSRRMIADAIEEAIFDAFDIEPPADNTRPVRNATPVKKERKL